MNDLIKLVPNLRFPAFIQDGEWKEQKFGSLFAFLPNNTLSRADLKEGKGDVYNVHYGDVLIKLDAYTDIQRDKLPAIKTVDDIEKYRKACLQDGDIVIADTAEDETVGKCTEIVNVHNTLVVSGLHTIPCRPQTKFAQAYLGYYMNSNAFHNKLLPIMQGVKVTSISKSALQNIDLEFPESLEEQQKIAKCLSSIDSYISSINEKVEQLKAHKKSLMQKLFPQRGQTVPEYRFSEFKELGMWTEKTLGDIGDVCMCKRIMKNETNINYSIPFYKIGTFGKKADTYITEEQFNEYKAKYSYPEKGDILFSAAGTIGRYVEFDGEPAYFQDSNIVWIANDETLVCNKFLKYLYSKVQWNIDDGGVVKRLYNDSIKKTSIHLPSMSEQRKIAGCLSSIDEAITLYSEKVSLIEQHKKGLMQQLFPTPK